MNALGCPTPCWSQAPSVPEIQSIYFGAWCSTAPCDSLALLDRQFKSTVRQALCSQIHVLTHLSCTALLGRCIHHWQVLKLASSSHIAVQCLAGGVTTEVSRGLLSRCWTLQSHCTALDGLTSKAVIESSQAGCSCSVAAHFDWWAQPSTLGCCWTSPWLHATAYVERTGRQHATKPNSSRPLTLNDGLVSQSCPV